jgi:hypothetical protein
MALECGFKRIAGIDFSQDLCELARENIRAYKARTRLDAEIEIINMDAVDYDVQADDTVFYFFNPFDERVLGSVLDNVTDSLAVSPRNVWIIYHNPLWRHVIERWTIFKKLSSYKSAECEFAVYTNKE